MLENCLKSINKAKLLNNLNIFITNTFDLALKQANSSQNRLLNNCLLSKLDGKTFTIKDNISTKSIRTTCGSKMLENYIPPFNATVVEKLFNSGAVLIGKTNMDEFGMGSVSSSHFGTVKNPINLNLSEQQQQDLETNDFYISGGSSGGSAASVSSQIVDFSIGSDTGGSIRNPASICGVIGYKPTYGLVSRYGLIPLNNYFDTIGIVSRSIQILVDVLNQIAGPDPNDLTTINTEFRKINLDESNMNMNEIKIGIPEQFYPNGLSQNNLNAWINSLNRFKQLGLTKIIPVSMPNVIYSMSCYSVLTSCEIASNFSRYDGLRYGYHTKLNLSENQVDKIEYKLENILKQNRDESLGKVVKGRIASGNYFLMKNNYEKYYLKSHLIKNLIVNDFRKVFDQVDLLITPTCFHDTQYYSDYLKQEQAFDEKDFFTACVNIAGCPAISLPVDKTVHGLPIGIQLISKWNRDTLLINVSNTFLNK